MTSRSPDRGAAPGVQPTELRVDTFSGVAVASIGDVFMALWSTPAKAARIRFVADAAVQHIEACGGTIRACQFLLPSASPPGPAEVRPTLDGARRVMPHARVLVNAPLGDGAWVAVVRGVMRVGVTMFGQARRVRIASTVDASLALLAETGDAGPDVDELWRSVASLHRALELTPPQRTPAP